MLHAIRHTLWSALPAFVVILTLVLIVNQAGSVEPVLEEQTRLERRFAQLQAEHTELQRWVIEEFRPWVIRQAERQSEALPSGVPEPIVPPLPGPSPVPTPTALPPTPAPEPPSPTVPTETVEPSPTCIPVVEICLDESVPSTTLNP